MPTQPLGPCLRLGDISSSKKRAWEPYSSLRSTERRESVWCVDGSAKGRVCVCVLCSSHTQLLVLLAACSSTTVAQAAVLAHHKAAMCCHSCACCHQQLLPCLAATPQSCFAFTPRSYAPIQRVASFACGCGVTGLCYKVALHTVEQAVVVVLEPAD